MGCEQCGYSGHHHASSDCIDYLKVRLSLAEQVVEAADRVATEVFGYEPYDKAMGDLVDALRAYDAAAKEGG